METVEVFILWAEVLMAPTSSGYPPLYTLWLGKNTLGLRNIETPYSGALIVKVTRQWTNTVNTLHKIYVTLLCHEFTSFSRFVCMYKLHVSNFEKDANNTIILNRYILDFSNYLNNWERYRPFLIYLPVDQGEKGPDRRLLIRGIFLLRWVEITRKCTGIEIST